MSDTPSEMIEEIKTPRTDAIADDMEHLGVGGRNLYYGKLWNLSRQLEHELAQSTTELEQARETLFKRDEYQESLEVTFSKQVMQLESERDRYKESYEGQLRNTTAFMKEKEAADAEIELLHAQIQELEAKLQYADGFLISCPFCDRDMQTLPGAISHIRHLIDHGYAFNANINKLEAKLQEKEAIIQGAFK